MKRIAGVLIGLGMAGMLTACGSEQAPEAAATEVVTTEATEPVIQMQSDTSATEQTETGAAQTTEQSAESQETDMAAVSKYQEALEAFYQKYTWPDGTQTQFDGTQGDITENQFAVFDVDGDGKKELILTYSTSFMAEIEERVYDYDSSTNSLRLELSEFPALTYYENGLVKADASHNQGLAGEFWPYVLYQYDAATDAYQMTTSVDAWDRTLAEQNYDGDDYPEDIDTRQDGIVYYVIPDYSYSEEFEYYNRKYAMNQEDFDAWEEKGGVRGAVLSIPYETLTEEHIAALTD